MSTEKQNKVSTVAALFDDQVSADTAIGELRQEHFSPESIGMAIPDGAPGANTGSQESGGLGTRTVATAGAAGAGYPGWTTGMMPWAFPGVGPVVVIGSLARAKTPDGPDDLRTLFMSLGLHEDVFGDLQSGLKQGRILVSIEAGGKEVIAKNILERNGGHALPRRQQQTNKEKRYEDLK